MSPQQCSKLTKDTESKTSLRHLNFFKQSMKTTEMMTLLRVLVYIYIPSGHLDVNLTSKNSQDFIDVNLMSMKGGDFIKIYQNNFNFFAL